MATETGREWHWVYAGESDRTKSLCNCNDGQHAPPYLAAMTARDTSLFSVIIADHQQATLLPEAIAALRKVRSLIAEHDIDEVHPLTWVNLIADDLDPLITKLADRTASQQEAQ